MRLRHLLRMSLCHEIETGESGFGAHILILCCPVLCLAFSLLLFSSVCRGNTHSKEELLLDFISCWSIIESWFTENQKIERSIEMTQKQADDDGTLR